MRAASCCLLAYQPALSSFRLNEPNPGSCALAKGREGLRASDSASGTPRACRVPGVCWSAAQWYRKMCPLCPHRACSHAASRAALGAWRRSSNACSGASALQRSDPTHVWICGALLPPCLLRSRPHSACRSLHHSSLFAPAAASLALGWHSKICLSFLPGVVWLGASSQCRPAAWLLASAVSFPPGDSVAQWVDELFDRPTCSFPPRPASSRVKST